MPAGQPLIGEVWVNTPTHVQGAAQLRAVISDVRPNQVVLLSSTGNRVVMPSARMGTDWVFSEPARMRAPRCIRAGCDLPGTLICIRQTQEEDRTEYVCARHYPTGATAWTFSEEVPRGTLPERIYALPCPACKFKHPVEDFRAPLAVNLFWQHRYWECPLCTARWGSFGPGLNDEDCVAAIQHILREVAAEQITPSRINVGPSLWDHLRGRFLDPINIENAKFFGVPLTVNGELPDYTATVQIRSGFTRYVSRLGGQPDMHRPQVCPLALPNGLTDLKEIPEDVPLTIPVGSIWLSKVSRTLVRVTNTVREGSEMFVYWVPYTADSKTPSVPMLRRDFAANHWRYVAETEKEEKGLDLSIVPGTEWINNHDDCIKIVEADPRNLTLKVEDETTHKIREIPASELTKYWKRMVRKSAFKRILEGDL